MYKERYELRKVRNPEAMGKPGKAFSVTHYTPFDGGTCLICAGTRYFETLEEAKMYQEEKERKVLNAGRRKDEKKRNERSRKESPQRL